PRHHRDGAADRPAGRASGGRVASAAVPRRPLALLAGVLAAATLVGVPAAAAPGGPGRAAGLGRLGADGGDVVLAALGDSVAAGHGLDLWDLLGDDDCWRAADKSYAGRVEERLEDALGVDVDHHHLACSGATTADLLAPDG